MSSPTPSDSSSTTNNSVTEANIVVIGNGVGGSQLSVKLLQYSNKNEKNWKIVVIAANNFTEISMNMTRAVAAGPSEHRKCIYPLFQEPGIRYAVATVTNLNEKQVTLDNGQVIKFDVCVVCTGQKHPIFAPCGSSGLHRTMESRQDFIAAVHASVRQAKNIVIAGGGGVGCEAAADIKLRYPGTSVTVVHPQDALLSSMSSTYSNIGTSVLKSMGVKMLLERRVKSASVGKVVLDDGVEVPCDLLLNAYPRGGNSDFMPKGVSNVNGEMHSTVDDKGYIKVNQCFQVDTFTNVFAFGDCSNFDPIKSYIRIEDQLPTVYANVVGLLEGGELIQHARGTSFQSRIVGPAIVALGHGVDGGVGVGPDWPGMWGWLAWAMPFPLGSKWPFSPSYGPQIATIKSEMNYAYQPTPGVGVASTGRTK